MMAMALPPRPEPEFTIICIDNGPRALCNEGVYRAQINGARFYCKTVLECNPENIVCILLMNSKSFNSGQLVLPTSDLQQIQSALEYVHCPGDGETEFGRALSVACSAFSTSSADMKKRLLMFVGCTIQLDLCEARSYGEKLNASSVALDVFNFRKLDDEARSDYETSYFRGKYQSIFEGEYHYAREELGTLAANANGHVEDIIDEYETSVTKTLESMLAKHLDYLKIKDAADDEKNKSVEAPESDPSSGEESPQSVKRGLVQCPSLANTPNKKEKTT